MKNLGFNFLGKIFVGIVLYAFYFVSCLVYVSKERLFKDKYKEYYFLMNISKFDVYGLPYLPIIINNQTELALLDLGFQGCFSLSSSILNSIPNKKFQRVLKYYGITNKEFQNNVYTIPSLNIGSFNIGPTTAAEMTDDFFLSAIIGSQEKKSLLDIPKAIIGIGPFLDTNIFLDLANLRVGIVDSLGTLQKNEFSDKHFVKVPLLKDRGFIEIEVSESKRAFRCVLDTGATHNIFHKDFSKEPHLKSPFQEHSFVKKSLSIGGEAFDSVVFLYFPITLGPSLNIEALLGVEFFKKHVVFIDFAKGFVYLAKNNP